LKPIQIWNLIKGTLAYSMYGHSGEIKTSAISAKGDFFATGGADGSLLIWKSGFSNGKGETILQQGLCETGHRVDPRTNPTV
jgi:WD40 repeat protein